MSKAGSALIIGAAGGLGASLVEQIVKSERYAHIHAVSRSLPANPQLGVKYHVVDSSKAVDIENYCHLLLREQFKFSLIVCCIGMLHGTTAGGRAVSPEKRLEDLHVAQLRQYFQVNTIIPAMWLKHLGPLMAGSELAHLVFFSARVGSIADNQLGGWYGYRASKAALNMLLKSAQVEFQRRAKNVSIVCYHPGTVDTALSKPFQANVKPEKLFNADFSAQQLLLHLDSLGLENGPHFIDWQGQSIPW
ncbi:MAG: SDR family NAD(P)-dependent oxidoreductase [Paraglaciecola sp.]|nr:SDR family NAD(P)-dependent oxidoreductase [Paraglaciecola sp.]NCT47663.1 SDR family NAD(P)-dependent oxidoreductase [Paraglaciecola sp.]